MKTSFSSLVQVVLRLFEVLQLSDEPKRGFLLLQPGLVCRSVKLASLVIVQLVNEKIGASRTDLY